MTFMFWCRARFAFAAGCASLLVAGPALADSFPSGWTDDDAPPDVQPPPQQQAPQDSRHQRQAAPAPTPAQQNLDNEQQQQPDPSWVAPNDAATPNATAPDGDDADTDPSALNTFNGALAGHGTWVDDPDYGRIWIPNTDEVGEGFAPYQTAGHWALDDQSEWLWVSDAIRWGYVPFHYGRWLWVPARGLELDPGSRLRTGVGLVARRARGLPTSAGRRGSPGYYWWRGRAVGFWRRPVAAYCFAPTGRIFAPNLGSVVVRSPASVRAPSRGGAPAPITEQVRRGGRRAR